MRLTELWPALGMSLIAAAFLPPSVRSEQPSRTALPRPTEIAPGQDEEQLRREREEWIESLHRAAPGTDWRKIERQNWAGLLEARNAAPGSSLVPSWFEVGSYNLAGRTHQSVYDAASHKLYVGAALGGVWRGDFDPAAPNPTGMGWTPLSDNVYGGARGIVLLPGTPGTILKSHSGFFSGEIHRSINGGGSWSVVATTSEPIKRILKLGGASTTVFAITRNLYTPQSTLYRSTNGGASFSAIRTLAGYEGDIWTSRTSTGSLYLLTNNRIEVSTNQGGTWSIEGTLPYATATRSILAGSEAGMPRLYAVAMLSDGSSERLFRSDDAGFNWVDKGLLAQNVFDNVSFAASTTNPDLLLYGGVECWRSVNGGTSFSRINGWGEYYAAPATRLHADIPGIDFVPLPGGGEALFIGTDGGTYFSGDGGATISNLSLQGLRISQYYSTLSPPGDASQGQAGSQDQGFQVRQVGAAGFDQVISGDYGHLTSGGGLDLVFAVYPGFVLAVENAGGTRHTYQQSYPAGEENFWMAPLAADPGNPRVAYLGARQLHRYQLSPGGAWSVTPLPFNFQGQAGEVISGIAIAPSDPFRWYVATNRGRLFYSTNGGSGWNASTFTSVPDPHYLTGLAIAVDPTAPLRVAVGGSGYSNPAVFRSLDGGVSFTPLETGQPATLVYGLAWGSESPRNLYAATESGPWRLDAASGTWGSLLQGTAPMTTYWSVEYGDGRMRFGTYGRGIWDYVVCSPPSEVSDVRFSNKDTLAWSAVSGAVRYDIVRGNLGQLPVGPGGGDEVCFDDQPVASFSDPSIPSGGFFYVARAEGSCGSGSFGMGHVNPGPASNGPPRATATCP